MTEIETAIWSHYNSIAAMKTSFVNGLHNTQADQNTNYPFAVFQIISDVPEYNFTDDFEDVLIQFRLLSKQFGSSSELNGMFTNLKSGFDFAVLTITDYTTVQMIRESAIKSKDEDVWQYLILYRLLVQRDVSVR